MKIQKLNNCINSIRNTKPQRQPLNNELTFTITDEYVKDGEKNVSIKFNKKEITDYIKSFFKNKDNSLTLKIKNERPDSLSNNEKEKITDTSSSAEIKNKKDKKSGTEIPKATEEIEMTDEKAVEILKKYNPNAKAKQSEIINAIEYLTQNEVEDTELPYIFLTSNIDDVAISVLKFYEKLGDKNFANHIMLPITSKKYTSLTERSGVYKEVLNAIQQLADLTNYTEKERKDIFYSPIENLLNHSDEEIRKLAQETLEKITPKE